jgi:hypothetical protein
MREPILVAAHVPECQSFEAQAFPTLTTSIIKADVLRELEAQWSETLEAGPTRINADGKLHVGRAGRPVYLVFNKGAKFPHEIKPVDGYIPVLKGDLVYPDVSRTQAQKVMAACQAVLSPAGFTLLSARTTRAMLFGFTSGLEAPLSQEVAVLSPNLIETFKGNSRQMQFFRAACSRARFAACQAGPGTGKTELLASLAVNYAVASQRVLVVAPSWKAVEVLARRIVDKERSSSFSVCIWSRWSRGR